MPHSYDSQRNPQFPTLPVVLHNYEDEISTSSLTAYLDTGADGTIVPLILLEELDLDEDYVTYMRSHWGERREVSVYVVDIDVAGEYLPGVEVLADEYSDEVLLGRNVLNRLILLLDGFRTQTDVLTRRPQKF